MWGKWKARKRQLEENKEQWERKVQEGEAKAIEEAEALLQRQLEEQKAAAERLEKERLRKAKEEAARRKKIEEQQTALRLECEKELMECDERGAAATRDIMKKLLNRMARMDEYDIFHEPVDAEEVPDYYDVIKQPMDYSKVEEVGLSILSLDLVAASMTLAVPMLLLPCFQLLTSGAYSSLEDFASDMRLIFNNAMEYNAPDTLYYKSAKKLLKDFNRRFETLSRRLEGEVAYACIFRFHS